MTPEEADLRTQLVRVLNETEEDEPGSVPLTGDLTDELFGYCERLLEVNPYIVPELHGINSVFANRAMFSSFGSGVNISDTPWWPLHQRLEALIGPQPD